MQGRGPPSGSFYEMVKKQYLVLSVGGAQIFCVFLFRFFFDKFVPFCVSPYFFFLGLLGKFNDFFMLLGHGHFFKFNFGGKCAKKLHILEAQNIPLSGNIAQTDQTPPQRKFPGQFSPRKTPKGVHKSSAGRGTQNDPKEMQHKRTPPPQKYIHRTKYGFLHFRGSSVLKEKFTVCAALPCAGRRDLFLCCTIASCAHRRGEVFLCLEKWSVWGTTAQKGGCTPTCLSRRCLSCCLSAPQNGFICSTSSGLLHKTMKFNAVPHLMSAGFRGTEAHPDSDQAVF